MSFDTAHLNDSTSNDDLNKSFIQQQKLKNYRVKNKEWHCEICSIYCNSVLQFEMHLISQKHKNMGLEKIAAETAVAAAASTNVDTKPASLDENNNTTVCQEESSPSTNGIMTANTHRTSNVRIKSSYSPIEISQNLIAIKFNVNAEKYLIPENKKNGKFEKFGFYCSLCNAYMTGQIQLIMHVKGAKHQYFSPNEIPGYTSAKLFNPNQFLHSQRQQQFATTTTTTPAIKTLSSTESNRVKLQQQQQQQINELKLNYGSSTGGGTYYDYLARNEALMYGLNNHHHHHHHQQRITFNSVPTNLNQLTTPDQTIITNITNTANANWSPPTYEFFVNHHQQQQQQQHANIYITPTRMPNKYLQVQQQQQQYSSSPPPPPPSLNEPHFQNIPASLQESVHTPNGNSTPVSTHQSAYQIASNNNSSRIRVRFNNGMKDEYQYSQQQYPINSGNGISIMTSKSTGQYHSSHHQHQHPSQCNIYFTNANIPLPQQQHQQHDMSINTTNTATATY